MATEDKNTKNTRPRESPQPRLTWLEAKKRRRIQVAPIPQQKAGPPAC